MLLALGSRLSVPWLCMLRLALAVSKLRDIQYFEALLGNVQSISVFVVQHCIGAIDILDPGLSIPTVCSST